MKEMELKKSKRGNGSEILKMMESVLRDQQVSDERWSDWTDYDDYSDDYGWWVYD